MEYNRLVAVTGLSGLFELLSSKSDGGVVRSLDDNSKKFVSSRIHQFSHLESIEVYTTGDNVFLTDVFLAMQESKEPLPDSKSDQNSLQAYFKKVFPDMDFTRVYGSDMKKMVKWFTIIQKNKIDIKAQQTETEENSADAEKKPVKENKDSAAKATSAKAATIKQAPAKKLNTPRRMA